MAITYECAGARPGRPRTPTRVACCAASSSRWPRCAPPGSPSGRRQHGARGLRRQRVHGRLADGPTAPRRPVPHHLGGHREHPLPSTSAGPCGASRPTWPWRPGSSGPSTPPPATRCWPAAIDTVAGGTGRRPRGPSPIKRASTTSWQLLQSRRLAELLADTAEGALLLDEAAWALERDGDARKAAVARRFVTRTLADAAVARPARHRPVGARPLRAAITRYGPIDAGDLVA